MLLPELFRLQVRRVRTCPLLPYHPRAFDTKTKQFEKFLDNMLVGIRKDVRGLKESLPVEALGCTKDFKEHALPILERFKYSQAPHAPQTKELISLAKSELDLKVFHGVLKMCRYHCVPNDKQVLMEYFRKMPLKILPEIIMYRIAFLDQDLVEVLIERCSDAEQLLSILNCIVMECNFEFEDVAVLMRKILGLGDASLDELALSLMPGIEEKQAIELLLHCQPIERRLKFLCTRQYPPPEPIHVSYLKGFFSREDLEKASHSPPSPSEAEIIKLCLQN